MWGFGAERSVRTLEEESVTEVGGVVRIYMEGELQYILKPLAYDSSLVNIKEGWYEE